MMKWFAFIALVFVLALPVMAQAEEPPFGSRIEVAQQRESLWDRLFGPQNRNVRPPANVGNQPSTTKRAPARRASLPPAKPKIEKNEGATRLVVFGDSLAVDLAKAMDRFYAEDPNLAVISQGVGSSGIVRDDFFDWNKALNDAIAADSFDIAVMIIGINDRQNLRVDGKSAKPLTDSWKGAYSARVNQYLSAMRAAGKPVIWIGMPPMQARSYSVAISEISSLQKLSVLSNGFEFVDVYERFADENGNYVSFGPDINGVSKQMRKGDGIHFSAAGSDKLAFYINQSMKRFYRGGAVSLAIADPLAGTDAGAFQRLPFQGVGQVRLLEVAGAIVSLREVTERRSSGLLIANPAQIAPAGFNMEQMVMAPAGRADAFGVGVIPSEDEATVN